MATNRTGAQKAALEKKALANENKSDGMRSLFEAGYDVATVRTLFGVPYGFAYGVATRAGFVESTPRTPKAKAPAKAKAAPKAAAKTTAKAAPRTAAAARSTKTKAAAKS